MNSYLPILMGAAVILAAVASVGVVAACALAGRCDRTQRLQAELAELPAQGCAQAADPLLGRAMQAIDGFRDAMRAYKEMAEQLQGRLEAQRTELSDWQAAATYHAESVRRMQLEIADLQGQGLRLQQENTTLRALYVARTQEALAAGMNQCVLYRN